MTQTQTHTPKVAGIVGWARTLAKNGCRPNQPTHHSLTHPPVQVISATKAWPVAALRRKAVHSAVYEHRDGVHGNLLSSQHNTAFQYIGVALQTGTGLSCCTASLGRCGGETEGSCLTLDCQNPRA